MINYLEFYCLTKNTIQFGNMLWINYRCGSGDQLSAQNSLKINIKFLDGILDIDFLSLTIIFCLWFFLDITIFFIFSPWQNGQFLDFQGQTLTVGQPIYYMSDDETELGSLSVYVRYGDPSIVTQTPQLLMTGNEGQQWKRAIVPNIDPKSSDTPFQFVIESIAGNGLRSDIAIDDITMSAGCMASDYRPHMKTTTVTTTRSMTHTISTTTQTSVSQSTSAQTTTSIGDITESSHSTHPSILSSTITSSTHHSKSTSRMKSTHTKGMTYQTTTSPKRGFNTIVTTCVGLRPNWTFGMVGKLVIFEASFAIDGHKLFNSICYQI